MADQRHPDGSNWHAQGRATHTTGCLMFEEVENDFSAAAWFSGASCHHVVHWAATCYLWLSGIRNMGSVTEELNF